jgi:hypothetical protein
MNNQPPMNESAGGGWTPSWANWFQQVFNALPWKKGFNFRSIIDFPSIAPQSQASTTVSIKGARAGDAVQITPLADTAGIVYSGVVTSADTVTVYAKNYTAAAVDPASTTFRIIVIQN